MVSSRFTAPVVAVIVAVVVLATAISYVVVQNVSQSRRITRIEIRGACAAGKTKQCRQAIDGLIDLATREQLQRLIRKANSPSRHAKRSSSPSYHSSTTAPASKPVIKPDHKKKRPPVEKPPGKQQAPGAITAPTPAGATPVPAAPQAPSNPTPEAQPGRDLVNGLLDSIGLSRR